MLIAGDGQVTLTWTTASEKDNDYFEIQRQANSDWITVGTVQGTNEVTGSNYQYVDSDVINGVTYTYRLISHDINGTVHEYELTAQATPGRPSVPVQYALYQNYPNPFNPITTISYDVAETGFVSLKIYDVVGREVAILVDGKLAAGSYAATWNARGLPSGIYLCRMDAGSFTKVRKLLLVK